MIKRIAVYVDATNMWHSARELAGSGLDYDALLERIKRHFDGDVVVAHAYLVYPPGVYPRAFLGKLERIGYKVTVKSMPAPGVSTNCDVNIAVDALRDTSDDLADIVVIASGDADFIPLIVELREWDVHVCVAAFAHSCSRAMQDAADSTLPLGRHDLLAEDAAS